MSTADLQFQARKKSPWAAALMNIIPGAGYFYSGRWVLGSVAVFLALLVALIELMNDGKSIFSAGFTLFFVAILMIHGFTSASNYNKQLLLEIIAEEDKKRTK